MFLEKILNEKQKQILSIQIGREDAKLSLFAGNTILYVENPKVSTQTLLELINEFSELQDIRLIYRNLLLFYTLIMNYQKENLRKQPHLHSHQENKIPRKKHN